jgi:hypothetical protein
MKDRADLLWSPRTPPVLGTPEKTIGVVTTLCVCVFFSRWSLIAFGSQEGFLSRDDSASVGASRKSADPLHQGGVGELFGGPAVRSLQSCIICYSSEEFGICEPITITLYS